MEVAPHVARDSPFWELPAQEGRREDGGTQPLEKRITHAVLCAPRYRILSGDACIYLDKQLRDSYKQVLHSCGQLRNSRQKLKHESRSL